MYYAGQVVKAPLAAPHNLAAAYNSSPANWTYPIPLRIAYYYSIAAIMKLSGVHAEQAGVALSTFSSILQLAMVALVGLRFFNRWTTLVALALLAVSPQDLAMARRVWGDGVSGCAAMIILWLCAEICTRRRARVWYALLWTCGAYFLLLKESGGFFLGFCALGLAVHSWRRDRSWKHVAWILAGAAGTGIFSFALMARLCGGAAAALETVHHSAQAAPTNLYGALYQSGPWYSFPLGLWILSPLTAFGCAAGLIALILPENSLGDVLGLDRQQREIASGMGVLILLVIAAATLPPALKNLRYISFIAGPWYLMGALGLSYIMGRLRSGLGHRAAVPLTAIAAFAVLYSCRTDYLRFRRIILRRDVKDLDIRQIVTSPFDGAGS